MHPNKVKTALLYDFLFDGVSYAVIQLSDNFLFLNRYKAVMKKIPEWKDNAIKGYIFFILTITWLPAYTIAPYFVDTNSREFWACYKVMLSIQGWGSIVFNFFFTVEFLMFLKRSRASNCLPTSKADRRNNRIAMKSIIHCMTSSGANFAANYSLVECTLVYLIVIPAGLHILFNSKIEYPFRSQKIAVEAYRLNAECVRSSLKIRHCSQPSNIQRMVNGSGNEMKCNYN